MPISAIFARFRLIRELNTHRLLLRTVSILLLISKRGSSKSIQVYFSILNVSSNTSLFLCLCMCACVSEIQYTHLFTFERVRMWMWVHALSFIFLYVRSKIQLCVSSLISTDLFFLIWSLSLFLSFFLFF